MSADLADHVSTPVFATPVGLLLYAHRNRAPEPAARRVPERSAAWQDGCAAFSRSFSDGG